MITSLSNKNVRRVISLSEKGRERRKEGVFVTEGLRMIAETPRELLSELYLSRHFLSDQGHMERLLPLITEMHVSDKERLLSAEGELRFGHVSVSAVSDEVMRKMSGTVLPQGVMAVTKMPVFSMADMLTEKPAVLLFTEHLQDPGNLGTIFRSSEGAGVTGLILSSDTVDPYMPKVVRSTMGSIFRVPHCIVPSLADAVREAKAAGVKVLAAHLAGQDLYRGADLTGSVGFLIGNEGNGLTEEISKLADERIRIPMKGQLESLNAGVAASLLVYETMRQRRNP